MANLVALIQPILASAVVNFGIGWLIWMVFRLAKNDWTKAPFEAELIQLLKSNRALPPNRCVEQYPFPYDSCAAFHEGPTPNPEPDYEGYLVVAKRIPFPVKLALTFTSYLFVAGVIAKILLLTNFYRRRSFGEVYFLVFLIGYLGYHAGKYPCAFWARKRLCLSWVQDVLCANATAFVFAYFLTT